MLKNKLVNLLTVILTVVLIVKDTKSVTLWHNIDSHKLCDHRYLNDKIRIDGKVVIVTGGTSGLGFETPRNLAYRGGRIYIGVRGETRGAEAVKFITEMTGNRNVKFIQLDLGSLKSVRKFSETFHAVENRLDILINNAGVALDYNKIEDGFESNMGINHLGHFLLTNLLLDLLKASAPSRILVVTSSGQYFGYISRNNLNSEKYFPGIFFAYANTKLAHVLFTLELSRRLKNTGVTANSLDPGLSKSDFAKNNLPSNISNIFALIQQYFGRTPEHATETYIMLAVDPSVNNVSGKHFRDCVVTEPAYFARDKNMALWLWNESEKLTKLHKWMPEN